MNHSQAGETDIPWERLGAPARRALEGAGFRTLEQLSRVSEREVAGLHGIGPSALKVLRAALAEKGLGFARGG
jgi:hypothetical protein